MFCTIGIIEKIKRFFIGLPITPSVPEEEASEETEEVPDEELPQEMTKESIIKRKSSATSDSSRIPTPECCRTGGYVPFEEEECRYRGYPTVDLRFCAGFSSPPNCCDASSTEGYIAVEEGGCQAYGFEEADPSSCSSIPTAPPEPAELPSATTDSCCQNWKLVCEHTNFIGNNNLGPDEPTSEAELPRLRNGNDACSDEWSSSTCVLTYGVDPTTETMVVRPCAYSYRDLDRISLDFPNAVCCRLAS